MAVINSLPFPNFGMEHPAYPGNMTTNTDSLKSSGHFGVFPKFQIPKPLLPCRKIWSNAIVVDPKNTAQNSIVYTPIFAASYDGLEMVS